MEAIQYIGVQESKYTKDHPLVTQWSNTFTKRFEDLKIFETFKAQTIFPSPVSAKVAGAFWYCFSDMMPWVLCTATARISSNQIRHYTIQSAFEELGMRNKDEIHSELFISTTKLAEVSSLDHDTFSKNRKLVRSLSFLKKIIKKAKSDSEILGILLGLEILANENINTLFSCLAVNDKIRLELAETKFFQIHNVVETEHIRLAVSNFLRFCKKESEQKQFLNGCDKGLKFWVLFWSSLSDAINSEAHNG